MRVLTAVNEAQPSLVRPALEALMKEMWLGLNEKHIETAEGLQKVLAPILGEKEFQEALKAVSVAWHCVALSGTS